MENYEIIILAILGICAAYYIYKKTFKSGGCGCGRKDCPTKRKNQN